MEWQTLTPPRLGLAILPTKGHIGPFDKAHQLHVLEHAVSAFGHGDTFREHRGASSHNGRKSNPITRPNSSTAGPSNPAHPAQTAPSPAAKPLRPMWHYLTPICNGWYRPGAGCRRRSSGLFRRWLQP